MLITLYPVGLQIQVTHRLLRFLKIGYSIHHRKANILGFFSNS